DPAEEALVGFDVAQYLRVDPNTGDSVVIGDLNAPGYASSGDIITTAGGATYLTVKGNGCSDCLVEVDPATGTLLSIIAELPYSEVFGLAHYNGVAYGFSSAGNVFEVDLATGATTEVLAAEPPVAFNGAASRLSEQ